MASSESRSPRCDRRSWPVRVHRLGAEPRDDLSATLSVEAMGVTRQDLSRPDQVLQIGLPPRRIDLLTSISGVSFEDAWPGRATHEIEGLAVPFLGRAELVRKE